jgi:hypothetical protein
MVTLTQGFPSCHDAMDDALLAVKKEVGDKKTRRARE